MALVGDLIVKKQPLVTGAAAIYPFETALQERFTVRSRFGEPFDMYRIRKGAIELPRAVCPLGVDDRREAGTAVKFTSSFKARNDEQIRIVDETAGFLLEGRSGILQASTGFGKTACSMEIIARVGVTTLVIVPKDDLEKQWIEAAGKFLGLAPEQVGIIRGDQCNVSGKKLAIAMLHSICKEGRYDQSALNRWGLVVIDECHRVAADVLGQAMYMLPAKLRLGLSATPERQDGKEIVLHAHIGPVRVKSQQLAMKPKVLRYRSNWTCPRSMKTDPVTGAKRLTKMVHTAGKVTHILKKLSADKDRNRLICELVTMAYNKGRNTVVMSELLEHLDILHTDLHAMGVPLKDMALYVGGMKAKELDQAKARRIVLASYKMCSEGTDAPWWDTLVLATPRSEIEQIAGRILREYPNKKEPVIFDIADLDSPVFTGYARNRAFFYAKIGAQMKDM